MKKLIQFLASITKQLRKSREGNGINCYDIEAINNHKTEIERLCADCGWFISYLPPRAYLDTDDNKQTSVAKYYLGVSKLKNDSEDDLLAHFVDEK